MIGDVKNFYGFWRTLSFLDKFREQRYNPPADKYTRSVDKYVGIISQRDCFSIELTIYIKIYMFKKMLLTKIMSIKSPHEGKRAAE